MTPHIRHRSRAPCKHPVPHIRSPTSYLTPLLSSPRRATYSTEIRPFTAPLIKAHRWRWCRRSSRRTRRPPRRRSRYVAPRPCVPTCKRPSPSHPLPQLVPHPTRLLAAACHVQNGNTPLHDAARYSSSVAVVQALLAAYPEAATATNIVRRPSPLRARVHQRVIKRHLEAHQRSSEAIRGLSEGYQRAIRGQSVGDRRQSVAISGHSEVIRGTRALRGHQRHSLALRGTHRQSQALRRNQRQSPALSSTQQNSESAGNRDGHDDPRRPAPSWVAPARPFAAPSSCAPPRPFRR
jgi:hypothetical protein